MTLNIYIFVAAAVVAVIPVLVIVKKNVNKLIANPEEFNTVQKQFFIGVALSKIVPVILLVYGIIKITPVEDYSDLYLPWAIILLTILFGLYFITSQKKLATSRDEKMAVNTLITIARPLVFSIPLMAAIFLFMMTLQ